MNELMIYLSKTGGYIYYKTKQMSPAEEFEEFRETCERAGINVDNLIVGHLRLDDENDRTIDWLDFETQEDSDV